jgi:hypothetical protein
MKARSASVSAILSAISAAFFLCGCQTICRPRFDIAPESARKLVRDIGDGPYVVVEVRRFSFVEFACNMTSRKNYPCREIVPGHQLMPELSRLFPGVFSDTPDAVPIIAMQNIRGGAAASPYGNALFDGACRFNRNLSRLDRSDMAAHATFSPPRYLNELVSACTFCLVPGFLGTYSSHYDVSIMTGYDNYGESVAYSAETGFWVVSSLCAPFFPESSGWIHGEMGLSPGPGAGPATPDATEARKQTALCCAIAAALAGLSPEERMALRRNPLALLRDKETGGNRSFRLVQIVPERETAETRMGAFPNRPLVLAQSYEPASRRGTVHFDTSACENAQAAISWVRDSYLPLVASQKGMALDATPAGDGGIPPARVSVTGFQKLAVDEYRIDFTVLE